MRLAYIIEGMYNAGGMERVVSQKANWLASEGGMEVTIVTFAQTVEQADFFPLHGNVRRVRMLSAFRSGDVFRLLHDDLAVWLKDNPKNVCISTYGREFRVLPRLKDGSKKVVEFHFAYDINKHWLANSCGKLKTAIIGTVKTMRMVCLAKKYDRIAVLSKADEKRWHSKKVTQIYNPHTIKTDKVSNCKSKTVVAVGRMDHQKGFDILINCWRLVEQLHPDWQLQIYGGGDAEPYRKQIEHLGLRTAKIMGRADDVQSVYLDSSIYVLSSRYEGFSLTICEAMTCGLPIVTFDCPSGPAELVKNGRNGFVVPKVGDIRTMANRICQLIENPELRKSFGKQSKGLSEKYSIDNIMAQWVRLFENL